ncbi:MAG: hypothetical protein U1F26_07150 [Lysobacterales bacterium]
MSWIALLSALSLSATPSLTPVAPLDDSGRYAVDGVARSQWQIQNAKERYTLVLSTTGSFRLRDGDERSARLYATLFVDHGDESQQQWVIQDRVDDCPFDLTASFTDPAVFASDADQDGKVEIWVAYRLACRSDVSPATLKLIGYEGQQKYALRGTARLTLGESHEGGDFQADPALSKAPALLKQAEAWWLQIREDRF